MSYPVLLCNLYDIAYLSSKGIIFWEHEFTNPKLYHLKHTLKMLDQYQWSKNTALIREKPEHDINSHIADALRYALYTYTI